MLPAVVAEDVEHWLAGRDVTVRPGERGTSVVAGTVSTADGARLTQRLTQVAGWVAEMGDTRTKHVLRSVALGMLADPGTVDNLYARVCAHRAGQDLLDFDPLAAPPSGCPLPATCCTSTTNPTCGAGPWTATAPSPPVKPPSWSGTPTCGDFDHQEAYPRGPTSTTNGGHLPCRRHHRVKTFTDWRVATITTGVWLWTSPASEHYLVTPGTTTPLR